MSSPQKPAKARKPAGARKNAIGLDRADQVGGWLVTIVIAIALIAMAVFAGQRIAEVARNENVPVSVELWSPEVTLNLDDSETPVEAAVDTATFTIPHLTSGAQTAIITQTVLSALVMATLLGCVGLFIINLVRGRAFVKSNVALMWITCVALLVGWMSETSTNNWVANEAFHSLGIDNPDGMATTLNLMPALASFVVALLAAAMSHGRKLQSDVDGLV